jgi:uncharacterized membrane protein
MFVLTMAILFLFVFFASTAFRMVGLSIWTTFLVLMGSLVGSAINIPLTVLESQAVPCNRYTIRVFGMVYQIPECPSPNKTALSVNVGGGVIPVVLSLWLIYRSWHISQSVFALLLLFIALILCSLVINRLARVRRGVGIVTPALAPPLVAALLAFIFAPSVTLRPVFAYVSGTLGALIGADLMNLRKIAELDSPFASIGGAGTWDGIFLTGIVAVLLV